MTVHEMEACIFSLEVLISLLLQELPEALRSHIVMDLLERTCSEREQAEIAESWDDEIRGGARTPEGTRIEMLHSRRRRSVIFGLEH